MVSLAVLAYAGATTIGGNGFVAAFAAGVIYRTATAAAEPSVEFADWIGVAGSYLVWLVFGVGFVVRCSRRALTRPSSSTRS